MPLSDEQCRVLQLLAAGRSPESYVAGASPVVAVTHRYSSDLDIFQDAEAQVRRSAELDGAILAKAGYDVQWQQKLPGFWSALATHGGEPVKVEWSHDSAFRFFAAQAHPLYGFVLHPMDLATNKALAAAGRREARDLVDLLDLSAFIPLPAILLAAPGKDPGYSPERLIESIMRFSNHPQDDFDRLRSTKPLVASDILLRLRGGLNDAMDLMEYMPSEAVGRVYLRDGRIVMPTPSDWRTLPAVAGRAGGVVAEIAGLAAEESLLTHRDHPGAAAPD